MGYTDKQWKALAARYKESRCTPDELRLIQTWYDNLEKHGHVMPGEAAMNHAAGQATAAALARIRSVERQNRVKKLLPWLSAAAALFLILTVAGLLFLRSPSIENQVTWKSASARPGTRKKIHLPDGSVISLNSASSIRYPMPFNGTNREIKLSGEAFFSVAPDQKHPFIVHTRQLDVRVLGTSYNISAYPDDPETKVEVASGKVAVSLKGNPQTTAHVLTAGKGLQYSTFTDEFISASADPSAIGAWQNNELIFNFDRLEDIVRKLERYYGVHITIRNKVLRGKRFELKIKNQSLSAILKLLSISGGNFSYKIDGKQVTIG